VLDIGVQAQVFRETAVDGSDLFFHVLGRRPAEESRRAEGRACEDERRGSDDRPDACLAPASIPALEVAAISGCEVLLESFCRDHPVPKCGERRKRFRLAGVYPDDVPETDAELIRRAREDPEALGELYLRWKHPLFCWFRGRLPESDASELTAELFAQVALNLRRFRDEADGSAGPWLYGIGKNLLRRYYERGRVEQEARRRLGMPIRSYEADFEAVDERLSADGLGLAAALDTLSEGHRLALELRVLEERRYDEIATALGCTEVAARLRVMKALGKLARLVRAPTA
jgi:RNA polymerase sigma factor (sigma-70 family)